MGKKIRNPVARYGKLLNRAVTHKPKKGKGSYGRQYNIDEDFYEGIEWKRK